MGSTLLHSKPANAVKSWGARASSYQAHEEWTDECTACDAATMSMESEEIHALHCQ